VANENWFSAVIIWERRGDDLYFLVQDSESKNPKYPKTTQTKFPGGMRRRYPEDNDPEDTICREMFEEIGQRMKPGVKPRLLCVVSDLHDGVFRRYFYLVQSSDMVGRLRERVFKVDGDQKLLPPHWIKVEGRHSGDVLYKTHRFPFMKAIEHFGLAV
jgi:ADP-ribose pyrophosphatase YjhB (NUDIX family)